MLTKGHQFQTKLDSRTHNIKLDKQLLSTDKSLQSSEKTEQ